MCWAEEGLWIPFEMDSNKIKSAGLEIPFQELFSSENSIKDAIVIFGGGCTGEVISNQGLILTNHHCGYYSISSVSDTVNNYLKNGFWAKSLEEEIPIKNLTVSFVKRYLNITDQVNLGTDCYINEDNFELIDSIRARNIRSILQREKKGNNHDITIKSTFRDTHFYLIELETFTDIRLVGTPPLNVANFGGDYDNWVFPRHSADFSIFRIYADSLQLPAKYSDLNQPYQPSSALRINIQDRQEDEFCMVYGFPGYTNEYASSAQINQGVNVLNPRRIQIRDAYLQTLKSYMDKSESDMLFYTSHYNRVSNVYKKMQGQNIGVHHFQVLQKKEVMENTHLSNMAPTHFYRELETFYRLNEPYQIESTYISELQVMLPVFKSFKFFDDFYKVKHPSDSLVKTLYKNVNSNVCGVRNQNLEKEVFVKLFSLYLSRDTNALKLDLISYLKRAYHGRIELLADDIFEQSSFFKTWVDGQTFNFKKDPLTLLYWHVNKGREEFNRTREEYVKQIERLESKHLKYFTGYSKKEEHNIYPDANGSLRLSYGRIKSYVGYQGELVKSFTTSETGLAMADKNANVKEYQLPSLFEAKLKQKNYGRYAAPDGSIKMCFISTNHTTGGNSGSPVLNKKGDFIGINFDRSWESTMSDYYYDENICRNIIMTSQYLLFIIDQYADCQHVMKELTIVE